MGRSKGSHIAKEDLLAYLELVLEQAEEQVDRLDLDAEFGIQLAAVRQAGTPVLQYPACPAAHR